jgi:cyclopropane fatty-acyl-phospholipid synthase-like methyltransferase
VSPEATPDPAVPQEVYDKRYYLELADGYEEFTAGGSAGRYAWALKELRLPQGGTLLDIGCGRGELVFSALAEGAARAIGVEYAEAAIEIAREAAAERGYAERVELLTADARAIPLGDATADGIAMLDVIEHLTPSEQADALRESLRLLKPGGRFVLHTFPNRHIYGTYAVIRRFWPGGGSWPEDPRLDVEHEMHVGEVTVAEMSAALGTAGFTGIQCGHMPWVYDDHFPTPRSKAFFALLAKFPPTKKRALASVVATATKPG